jgi:hypothetical protein
MFKFKHPFTCIIAGPTQSGKTHFTLNLLNSLEEMVNPRPTQIIWCYGEYQDKLEDLPSSVQLSEGLAGLELVDKNENNLVILDDLMEVAGNTSEVSELFTKGSHHRNLSVILIVQNLFHQGKMMRTMSLNSHYMVLFKNPRDAGQIRSLATQLFPGQNKFLVDAYKQATNQPHGYLLLDLTQSTADNRRVLSNILPFEEGFYYSPK